MILLNWRWLADNPAGRAALVREGGMMAESPMVLRMAEAMYDRFQECVARNFVRGGAPPWTAKAFAEADVNVRSYYVASARVGLEMLREPDEAMFRALGARAVKAAKPHTHAEAWAILLDAALAIVDGPDAA